MSADHEGVERRLLRLEQIDLATRLFSTYARAADAAAVDRMAALFTAEALVSTRRGEFVGTTEIAEYFAATWGEAPSEKRHFVTALDLDWRGPGLLEAQAYFLFVARAPETSVLGWGRYDATVQLHDGSARFSRLRIDLDVATDLVTGWPMETMPSC